MAISSKVQVFLSPTESMGKSLLLGFSSPILIVFRTHIKWDSGATWILWIVDFYPYPTIVLRKEFSHLNSAGKKKNWEKRWPGNCHYMYWRAGKSGVITQLCLHFGCMRKLSFVLRRHFVLRKWHISLQWCNFPFQDAFRCPKVPIWQFQWLQEASPYVQKSLLASGNGRQEAWSVKKINVICHSVMHFQNDDSPKLSAKYLIEALHSLSLHLHLLPLTHIFRCSLLLRSPTTQQSIMNLS